MTTKLNKNAFASSEKKPLASNLGDRMDIFGGPGAPQLKFAFPLLLLVGGLVCFFNSSLDEEGLISGFIGVTLIVVGLLVAGHRHHYLDFSTGEIIEANSFATYKTSTTRTPLANFSNIVVRHLCHPGREGEDTFTGSVGLKPRDGGAVFWMKDFPATKDEMPGEAHAFAIAFAARTGLPYDSSVPWRATEADRVRQNEPPKERAPLPEDRCPRCSGGKIFHGRMDVDGGVALREEDARPAWSYVSSVPRIAPLKQDAQVCLDCGFAWSAVAPGALFELVREHGNDSAKAKYHCS